MIERGNGPAPKAGTNSTGTYGGQTGPGSPFPSGARRAINPPSTGGYGRGGNSETGYVSTMTVTDVPPMETFRDTATQPIFPAAQPGSGHLMQNADGFTSGVPLQMPHEKGKFFGTRQRDLISTVGAPSNDRSKDTLRHPNPRKWRQPVRHASNAKAGERMNAASFGSGQLLTGNATNDVLQGHTFVGRWAQVKRGAAG